MSPSAYWAMETSIRRVAAALRSMSLAPARRYHRNTMQDCVLTPYKLVHDLRLPRVVTVLPASILWKAMLTLGRTFCEEAFTVDGIRKDEDSCTNETKSGFTTAFTLDGIGKDEDSCTNDTETDSTSLIEAQSFRICNILVSGVWDSKTTALLEPFAKGLSASLVARVLNRLNNVEMAKRFFLWAGEKEGYKHTTYVYNALIMKLGIAKQFTAIWEHLDEMQSLSCSANGTTFSIIIKYYGKAGLLEEAWATIDKARQFNCKPDIHMYTTLVMVLFEAKKVKKANQLVCSLKQNGFVLDTHLKSIIIRGLCKNGKLKEAQMFLNQMLDHEGCTPDVFTYNAVLLGLCEAKCLHEAVSWFDKMQKKGCKPDVYTYNALIGLFCDFNMFVEAEDVIKNAGCGVNQVTYNTLLGGLLKWGKVVEADECFKKMTREGWIDDVSYRIYSVHLRKSGDINRLLSLSEEMHSRYGHVNVQICNAILQRYCEDGNLNEAEKYFNEILSKVTAPNDFSYSLMINSHCKSGNLNVAMALLSNMAEKGCRPTDYCYNPVIISLCKASRESEAFHFFEEILDKGIEPSPVSCELLLRSLSDAGTVDEAIKVCKLIIDRRQPVKDLTAFFFVRALYKLNRLAEAKCLISEMRHRCCLPRSRRFNLAVTLMMDGNVDEAEKYFEDVKGLEVPNTVSYTLMIEGRCKKGKVDEARMLLDEMEEKGCAPSVFCYNRVIGGLSKTGRLSEAFKLFEEMLERGLESSVVSSNLMKRLCEKGMVDEILRLGKHIIEKGQTIQISSVASLLNVHKKVDRLEEVTSLVKEMIEKHCIKVPKSLAPHTSAQ